MYCRLIAVDGLRPVKIAVAIGLFAVSGSSQHAQKPRYPMQLPRGPSALSQDFGDIAVIVENGLTSTRRNLFDLAGTTLRFQPLGSHDFVVSRSSGSVSPDVGVALSFGHPGASLFPGDDDSQLLAFPAGFPFFGATYTSVWVNTDGNLSFGAPDFASSERDKPRHVLGPPRVSALLHDWNAFNALNPAGSGSIHAALRSNPDRLIVTWLGVADFEGGVSSTFQIVLHSSGLVEITFDNIDTPAVYGVTGIAQGGSGTNIHELDFSGLSQAPAPATGAILEAFAQYRRVHDMQIANEFYRTHPDEFDFLVVTTDFPVDEFLHSNWVSNKTHGISTPLNRDNGQPIFPATEIDYCASYGSAGELEQFVFMNNVNWVPQTTSWLVDPPVATYQPSMNIIQALGGFGGAVTLDGQTMSQVRFAGALPPDNGETSRFFLHDGAFYPRLTSLTAALGHEVLHRYGIFLRFVHPSKGTGFDSYDLLGRDLHHWSFFVDATVPASQFASVPRSCPMEGNALLDLGTIADFGGTPTNLAAGERVFVTPATQLNDGYSVLDQYIMGIRPASEVGPFFYVDEPRSLYTGQSLDPFNPVSPLDPSVTMRGWSPMGGIAFKGVRVDLTLADIQAYEKSREKGANPQGRRFWGPKGNLTVRYSSATRRVEPSGDASIVLSAAERELGDEADMIGVDGSPVDVKTMAFVLLVESGTPDAHPTQVQQLEALRQAWQQYANGPATGGRGRFDTSLDPAIH